MSDFHFLRPEWLLALIPLALLAGAAWRARPRAGAWQKVCDAHLLRHLVTGADQAPRRWPLAVLAVGWLVTVIALAGPAWERRPTPTWQVQAPTVVVADLSRSMQVTDIAPSRLERARYKLHDVLDRLEGGQTALVLYAEEPHVAAPLTDDPDVIGNLLPVLEPGLMPGLGSRLDRAIDQAVRLLDQAGVGDGRILVLADGPGEGDPVAAAARARDAGHTVAVIGVGTTEGGPVPGPQGRPFFDVDGRPVIDRLDETALAAIADAGGGAYAGLTADDGDLAATLRARDRPVNPLGGLAPTDARADVWVDEGVWLVLIPLALAPLAFRRGWLAVLAVSAGLGVLSPSARADDLWADLWATPDQQGAEAFARGDTATAADRFVDPAWRAAAQYREGAYDAAARTLADRTDADALYNRGNALARAGELEAALAAYDAALAQGEDPDARFNRDLVEQLLDQQQDQAQNQDPQGQGDQDRQQDGGGQGDQDRQQDGGEGDQDRQQSQGGEGDQDRQQSQGGGQQNRDPGQDPARESAGRDGEKAPDSGPAARERAEAERRAAEMEAEAGAEGESGGAMTEADQAMAQWLARIPDDPGGLLREKMRRAYQQRRYGRTEVIAPW